LWANVTGAPRFDRRFSVVGLGLKLEANLISPLVRELDLNMEANPISAVL
jgi:hypothetical protein